MTTKKRDILGKEELSEYSRPLYVVGLPYLWTLTYGWAIVGFYVRHETPLKIRVAHANHFHDAKKNYGQLAQEGAGKDCQWRYEGNTEISFQHIIKVCDYFGEVPRGPVNLR